MRFYYILKDAYNKTRHSNETYDPNGGSTCEKLIKYQFGEDGGRFRETLESLPIQSPTTIAKSEDRFNRAMNYIREHSEHFSLCDK